MPLPLDGFDLSIFHEDETEKEKPAGAILTGES